MFFEAIPWQAIILFATLLTSVGQIFNKYQVDRAASLQVNLYKYSFSLGLVYIVWQVSGLGWPNQWPMLLVYGVLAGYSVTLYTKASRHSLSKTVLATPASQVLEVLLASLILHEWQLFVNNPLMLVALFLVPVLIWLFFETDVKSKKWSTLMLLVMVYSAGLNLFAKYSLDKVDPLQLLLLQYLGCVLGVSLGMKVKKHRFYLGKKFALTSLAQSGISSTGVWLYYVGLQKATISQTTLLRMPVFLLFTTFFGLYLFREVKTMSIKKWLGVGVAFLIALIVITTKQ